MTAPNANVSTVLPASTSAAAFGRSVLVVDDEPMIRRIARLALEGMGHTVAEACNAAEADAAVRTANPPFDLVFLDLTLPDGDGAAVIPAIRRSNSGTRVLVVSGLGESAAERSDGDGYLAKPFTKSSLATAVQLVLGSRSSAAPAPPASA